MALLERGKVTRRFGDLAQRTMSGGKEDRNQKESGLSHFGSIVAVLIPTGANSMYGNLLVEKGMTAC
jgi:hypothetical protein